MNDFSALLAQLSIGNFKYLISWQDIIRIKARGLKHARVEVESSVSNITEQELHCMRFDVIYSYTIHTTNASHLPKYSKLSFNNVRKTTALNLVHKFCHPCLRRSHRSMNTNTFHRPMMSSVARIRRCQQNPRSKLLTNGEARGETRDIKDLNPEF